MIGILASGARLNVMKLAVMVMCVVATGFLLRVLAALVRESKRPEHRAMKAYHTKFHPRGRRGELIEMTPDTVTFRSSARAG